MSSGSITNRHPVSEQRTDVVDLFTEALLIDSLQLSDCNFRKHGFKTQKLEVLSCSYQQNSE